MRESLPLGLVVRMVGLGLRVAEGIRVEPRVPFSRGSLERQGCSRLQCMGGADMGKVLLREPIPWGGDSLVGGMLADA